MDDFHNEIRLEKIPLAKFVSALTSLLNKGVEYIDIIGIKDEEEDFVGISVIRDYLAKELRDRFDEIIGEDGTFPLDDEENLNDLI